MSDFVHLRAMTHHSAGLGALAVSDLVDAMAGVGAQAVTLSDRHGIYGAVQLGRCARDKGLKPIIAAEFVVQDRPLGGPSPGPAGTLLLLARTATGLQNLTRLSSLAWLKGWNGREPRLDLATLAAHAAGLIVLAAGPESLTGQRLRGQLPGSVTGRMEQLLDCFEREHVFVEVLRGDGEADLNAARATVALARQLGLSPVATADCRCVPVPELLDWMPGEPTVDLRTGRRHHLKFQPAQFVVGADVMAARFAEFPAALANTLRVAELIEAQACPSPQEIRWPQWPDACGTTAQQQLIRNKGASGSPLGPKDVVFGPHPKASPPMAARGRHQPSACELPISSGSVRGVDGQLTRLAAGGLYELLECEGLGRGVDSKGYWRRLTDELAQIAAAGCASAYLVYADLAQRARQSRIAIGPGPGVTGCSLVCRALGVTSIDPVANGLFFERQLDPSGKRPPALAMEVAHGRRQELLDHLALRHGPDRLVDLSQNLAGSSLSEDDFMMRCGGGTLAATPPGLRPAVAGGDDGIAICPGPALDWLPMMRDRSGRAICQYGRADVAEFGIWAVDVVASEALSAIATSLEMVNRHRTGPPVALTAAHLADPALYTGLRADMVTDALRIDLTRRRSSLDEWLVNDFDDLVALGALGTRASGWFLDGEAYGERKCGQSPAEPPHPSVADLLAPTLGMVLYDEQVIAIIAHKTGCSPAEAELDRQRMRQNYGQGAGRRSLEFVERAAANGNLRFGMARLFDAVQQAAGEVCSKADALHRATLAAQALWLKKYFPLEYAWVCLKEEQVSGKVAAAVVDAQRRGVMVHGPDVNLSGLADRLMDCSIRLGLRRLRGLASGVEEAVVAARAERPFTSIEDLADRLPKELATAQTLDVLACAGALDGLGGEGARDGPAAARPGLAERRFLTVTRARACATERLGLRMAALAGGESWDVERVVTEEQRAMGGVTVSGLGLVEGAAT